MGHLRREGNVHILTDVGTQVRLPHVDEESFAGPTSAAVDTAPPPGCQVGQEAPKCLKGGGVAANVESSL
eukprot:2791266-Alexandrium_andersonii.AAC.1